MSKAPPIPPDQRVRAGDRSSIEADPQPSDRIADKQADPADVSGSGKNLKQQDRQGNIHQNTHHQGYQQDR